MTTRTRYGLAALTLAGALLPAPSHAALLRGSGGAISQDTLLYIWGLTDASNVMEGDLLRSLSADVTYERSFSSTDPLAFATPREECFDNVIPDQPPIGEDGSIPEGWQPVDRHTACTWEFAEGDRIQVEGSFDNYLEGALVEFVWSIVSKTDPSKSWSWTGDDVDTGTIEYSGARVFLDVAMPEDMGVGDYGIFLAVTQRAPDGKRLYQRGHPSYSGTPVECFTDEAGVEDCGYAVDMEDAWGVGAPAARDSAGFRVIAAVPEPSSLALLAGGLLMLGAARRSRAGRRAE